MMRVGIAADHAGFTLKGQVRSRCVARGTRSWTSAQQLAPEDDYPDVIVPPWPGPRPGR